MGYDLHITRAKSWSENAGHKISSDEWLAYVADDPELSISGQNGPYFAAWSGKSEYPDPWLDWFDGNIYSKNPDEALIDKMVQIARQLHARVQGDDGELYTSGRERPVVPRPSLWERAGAFLQRLRPTPRTQPLEAAFKVGDRVTDVFHREATVVRIDRTGAMGKVTIRYDDGREASFALIASGLNPFERRER